MIVTSMQLTISSRRDIAVLQKESSSLEGEEDVNHAIVPHTRQIRRTPGSSAAGQARGTHQRRAWRQLLCALAVQPGELKAAPVV